MQILCLYKTYIVKFFRQCTLSSNSKNGHGVESPSNTQKDKCHAQKKDTGNYVHHGLKVRKFPMCFSNVPCIICPSLLSEFVCVLRQACGDVLKEGSRNSEVVPQHHGDPPARTHLVSFVGLQARDRKSQQA